MVDVNDYMTSQLATLVYHTTTLFALFT